MRDCVFCDIINGRAPGTIVKSWDHAVALVPLTPVVDSHVLIIPKLHVANAGENPDTTGDVMACASEYARIYDSFNLITSAGRAATQSIDHLHIHVVPRAADDQLMTPWGTVYGDDPTAPHWCRVAEQVAEEIAHAIEAKAAFYRENRQTRTAEGCAAGVDIAREIGSKA
jgi:histidine triad (HIT) family protein